MSSSHKKSHKRKIELLAPAKNAEVGKEALRHGADAVYIGPPAFGARAAAGNGIKEIQALADEAHIFGARVYVTMNTILYDNELADAEKMIRDLYRVGVDALIIQDLGLLRLDLPPIALHASTQMDITTAEKARFLSDVGFSQIVLARELSLDKIREIHAVTDVPMEAFVHGALCTSYSGRCYASEYCFGRSANRGRCAQFCRLPFDLIDGKGNILVHDSHLLSLKDMNRSGDLEEMMDAGISSFKIEGRLKDAAYVKNVTAAYRERIDEILARRTEDYERASYGKSHIDFSPRLEASFNRGFTNYFLHRRGDIASMDTPKSRGEYLGRITECGRRGIRIDTQQKLTAGDGICYITPEHKLEGMRINTVDGEYARPATAVRIPVGTEVWRNHNAALEKWLAKPTAVRRIALDIALQKTLHGIRLTATDERGTNVTLHFLGDFEPATTPQRENITRQLSKLGNTPFQAREIDLDDADKLFIPSSVLTAWRREMVDAMLSAIRMTFPQERRRTVKQESALSQKDFDYRANIANKRAVEFYKAHGAEHIEPAFELKQPGEAVLMTCRHCIRYALGHCLKKENASHGEWGQLYLRLSDGRRFPLRFDCKRCEMQVIKI